MEEKPKKERKHPYLAVDPIARNSKGEIVLIRRKKYPFEGKWVLPGGHVEYGESPEIAVAREFEEETGLKGEVVGLVGVWGEPDRDPRYHMVSLCYNMLIIGGEIKPDKEEALEVRYFNPADITRDMMGFDHYEMMEKAGVLT